MHKNSQDRIAEYEMIIMLPVYSRGVAPKSSIWEWCLSATIINANFMAKIGSNVRQ
jgi:hypothetical protein